MHYRHKKFGEPEPPKPEKKKQAKKVIIKNASENSLYDMEMSEEDPEEAKRREDEVWKALGGDETKARLAKIEEINKKGMSIVDKLLKKKGDPDKISDLHSIKEDSDDNNEHTTQREVNIAICNMLLGSIVDQQLLEIGKSMQKVHYAVKMWV